MNLPTLSAETNAWLRHVYSFLAGAAVVLGFLGMDADTQHKLIEAVHQIGDGVGSILAGLGIIVPIIAGLYAKWTAKPAQQIKAVNALPGKAVVDVGPDLADPPKPYATGKVVNVDQPPADRDTARH